MILGLSGVSRSGKDSAAKFLIELGWQRVAFADTLREAALAINPIVYSRVSVGGDEAWSDHIRLAHIVSTHGWDKAKQNPEVRRLLQVIGTEAGRDIHGKDCWIMAADAKINSENVVFTDVRFENECEYIRHNGGKVYHIERPGVGPVNSHVSDKLEFEPDGVILNDGTLDDLREKILGVVNATVS